jgi:malonate transporter
MSVILGVVLPVFGLILVGFGSVRAKLLDAAGVRGLSAFVFHLALPALLFRSLSQGSGGPPAGAGVVYAYFTGCLLAYGLAMAVGRLAFGNRLEEQAMLAITATFSNSVQLGIPVIFTAFGAAGERPALLVIAFHSVTLLTLTTVLVEIGLGRGQGPLRAPVLVVKSLAANPLILAIFAGIAWGWTGWTLPGPAAEFLRLLAGAAGPCALFALCASLAGLPLRGDLAESLAVSAIKLFLLPAAVWLCARFVFPVPPIEEAVATVLAALPTGVNPFILAQRYDLYVRRSASVIVLTTALAFVTLSAVLAMLAAPG